MDRELGAGISGLLFGLVGGFLLGTYFAYQTWNNWALDNGYAHFDQRTGELILHEKGDEDATRDLAN